LFYFMIILGILSLVTGLILYVWPHGFRSGRQIFGGFDKEEWSTIHTYVTLLLVPVLVAHITENRKCVKLYFDLTVKGSNK